MVVGRIAHGREEENGNPYIAGIAYLRAIQCQVRHKGIDQKELFPCQTPVTNAANRIRRPGSLLFFTKFRGLILSSNTCPKSWDKDQNSCVVEPYGSGMGPWRSPKHHG